ncbi:hypothetical protein HCN44_006817 [Aphidius gifuensis]|uniref:Uncharacterized protein n=1 Tax=Aphidius gifuensis TaxID=684658 RepID=A0A834Y0U4_APHGI|nr:hypothetical protein HCN44_006817 [Aphidius gifuensis]
MTGLTEKIEKKGPDQTFILNHAVHVEAQKPAESLKDDGNDILSDFGLSSFFMFDVSMMCISYTHLIHDVPTNVPMLYTGRFISGIGTGMANALYLYVTETAAPHQRAWLASSGPILVSLGVLVKFLPESLAWLARHGHSNEAKKSLLWLRGPGISYENEYKELCGDASIERRKKNSKIKLKTALLLPNVWKPFLILIIFFGLQQLSGIYIILFYAVNVLKEFGADIDGYIGSIAIGLVRLVASIINAFLAGHFGRRPLACTSAIGMTISSILVLLMKYNNYFLFIPKTLPIICIGCHVAFSMIRFLTLPWVLSSELYLLRFRGSLGRLTTGYFFLLTYTMCEYSN